MYIFKKTRKNVKFQNLRENDSLKSPYMIQEIMNVCEQVHICRRG